MPWHGAGAGKTASEFTQFVSSGHARKETFLSTERFSATQLRINPLTDRDAAIDIRTWRDIRTSVAVIFHCYPPRLLVSFCKIFLGYTVSFY